MIQDSAFLRLQYNIKKNKKQIKGEWACLEAIELYVLGSILVRFTLKSANQGILPGSLSQIEGTVSPDVINNFPLCSWLRHQQFMPSNKPSEEKGYHTLLFRKSPWYNKIAIEKPIATYRS